MLRRMIGALVALCVLTGAAPALAATTPADRYLVVFKSERVDPAAATRMIESHGGVVVRGLFDIGVAVVETAEPALRGALAVERAVAAVVPDVRGRVVQPRVGLEPVPMAAAAPTPMTLDPTQAPLFPLQWDLRRILAPEVWATGFFGDPDVTVAVLGSGLDYSHPELAGKVDLSRSVSFVPADDARVQMLFPGAHPIADLAFHSTWVAGIITCNVFRMACVAPGVTLVGVKIQDLNEQWTAGDLVSGLHYAASIDADVVVMAFAIVLDMASSDDRPVIQAIRRAVNHAHSRGSVVLAESFAPPFMPGIDADADGTAVIVPAQTGSTVVGASGPEDQWSGISNFGFTLVDVAAPGGWVDPVTNVPPMSAAIIGPCSRFTQFGTLPTICNQSSPARYLFIVGSKPATAHAAGVSALIASRYPNLPGAAIRARLLRTADDIGEPGRDPFFGHGRVNALRAVTE